MITSWLTLKNREGESYKFKVIDISEGISVDDSIKEYLGEQTLIQYRAIKELQWKFKNESPEKLGQYLRDYVFPSEINQITKNVKQGDFGEILTTLTVEQFKNLKVPISKLRYKFNKDRSIFCTDLISHNCGDTITDLTYYEVKTRKTYDKQIGVKAYEGLLRDEEKPTEAIADFLSRHYFEKAENFNDAGNFEKANDFYGIAHQFTNIVKNPQNYNRRFEIVIITEPEKFNNDILKELDNISLKLSPLEVTIVLVNDLGNIVREAFSNAEEIAKNLVFSTSSTPKNTTV